MNPYTPPGYPQATVASPTRTPFLLAAVGAWLAAAYWAALTLLIGVGAVMGSLSGVQIILPVVLVVLYVLRGTQLFKGDPNAARRILWLHGVGGVVAIVQVISGGGLFAILQGIKVAIHVFGGVTAYLAQRSLTRVPNWQG
jgi:hypothetical protein